MKQERVPFVADHAFALDSHLQQDRVAVAIGRGRDHFQRLPEVSPFVQSWLRVRLKNVT